MNPHPPKAPLERFVTAYEGEAPPWDIGRPQPAFVSLVESQKLKSPVLDVGTGTGELALYLTAQGHDVLGVDVIPAALAQARAKARSRQLNAQFELASALELEALGRSFETVVDCLVFHVFDDADRARYVESLSRVLVSGGRLWTLVFSDREPSDWGGPRRIRSAEIEQAFAGDFSVQSIEPALIATRFHPPPGGQGWMACIERR